MSAVSGPLLQWLEDRLEQNKQSIIELQQEKERLTQELAAMWGGGEEDNTHSTSVNKPSQMIAFDNWNLHVAT